MIERPRFGHHTAEDSRAFWEHVTMAQAAPDLYEALKAVEYGAGHGMSGKGVCLIPYCARAKGDGHTDTCLVGNALKKVDNG